MLACTPRTMRAASSERWSVRPKRVTVAVAPSTMSIRMRKRKKMIMAVDRANRPQKILRARASRKVSRIRARVTARVTPRGGGSGMNGPDEYVFEGAGGGREGFHLAAFGAQQVERGISIGAGSELEVDQAVARRDRGGGGFERGAKVFG